jgi:nitrile hydratase
VLSELGLDLPKDIEVRVWDSNAASRYFVLPKRPDGTDSMSEADLATLVTRDAMIGVAKVASPSAGGVS